MSGMAAEFKEIDEAIKIMEICAIIICTYYSYIKIIDINKPNLIKTCVILFSVIPIGILVKTIKYDLHFVLSWTVVILIISMINYLMYKRNEIDTIIVTTISFSISYILFEISLMLAFFPNVFLRIQNIYFEFVIILVTYYFITINIFKIKRIKHGISFLKKKIENQYFKILTLDIFAIALLSLVILQSYSGLGVAKIGISFIVISVIVFLTIKQSFDLYYKQNLLVKDLETTKKELEEKKQEIDKLEKENLEFSKTSHSLAHKQKALEFKLEQLMKKDIDIKSKENIKEEIENVSKELFKEPNEVKLAKTEIESIDNMFLYMQSECIKNNIKFELQVVGNIYYMINNLISENDLEILIADHIKDAIIAINHSDNLNRSILVRIGKIDNIYSLYIYDSGIEFTKEVLDNLGKKPITTHADNGGTGMGFMNTFDTLNKTKASLIIKEIGVPSEDNYTKVLIFKLDNQNEFKVNSYKNEVVV